MRFIRFIFVFFLLVLNIEASDDNKKLCLNMIVKNESKIIERCLDSVKNIVDCISICDTGSTDNTVQILEDYLKKNNIPGKIHRHEWKNFGHNRTLSAKAAQETLKELGFDLSNTWLLHLDADMILIAQPEFDKKKLQYDTYLIKQICVGFSYYNVRLAKASLPWECVGVTHEYWSSNESKTKCQLETLVIDDRADGGCKADKFERDIRLLTQGLKDEPHNARYVFYLAQSYRDIQNHQLSLENYEKRVNMGGWDEEVFESLLQIARLNESLQKPKETIINGYKKAYQYRPRRMEPLFFLANYLRRNNDYSSAYQVATIAKDIPCPNDLLFVATWIYDYGLPLELSVCAYWTGRYEECQEICKNLLKKENIPSDMKIMAQKNIEHSNVKILEKVLTNTIGQPAHASK